MNRYLLAAVLGAIAFLTLIALGNSQSFLRRAGDASRSSISATPSSAADNTLVGIEGAGRNVLRQTSPEAIERAGNLANQTTPALNSNAQDNFNPANPNATPPVAPNPTPQPAPAPAAPPHSDQEPIPALW